MSFLLVVFIILTIAASLLQVSFFPLPLGLVLILIWFIMQGTKHIVWLVLIFSLLLGSFANLPASLILLSTSGCLFLFILGKSFLPARLSLTLGLGLICLVVWEISLSFMSRLVNFS